MVTNLVVLSISLITNSQSAIVGERQGKALVASQETIVQRTDIGYIKRGKAVKLAEIPLVIKTTLSTNLVPFAFPAPAPSPTNAVSSPTNRALSSTNAPSPAINTNSPAYKRRLEREQRMKPSTNAPPPIPTK